VKAREKLIPKIRLVACVFGGVFLIFLLVAAFAADRPRIVGVGFVEVKVSNLEKSSDFYQKTFLLGNETKGCLGSASACLRLDRSQSIELVQTDGEPANRLEEVGLSTNDLEAMRSFLATKGLKCGEIHAAWDQRKRFELAGFQNPKIAFVSNPVPGSFASWPEQISKKMIHAGFVVNDRAAMDAFYGDLLGFRLYWHGGMTDDRTQWVDMQVPDGTDWIEYMLNIPADADKHTLGVMNHIALGVPDVKAAAKALEANGAKLTEQPKIGRDGKWQLNLYDPDQTRVELMEFTPVEKPCCAEYTGPHPKP
jgi:catechol 2,3-dioxygenase-like lactoylglutathione lyase family enzyme